MHHASEVFLIDRPIRKNTALVGRLRCSLAWGQLRCSPRSRLVFLRIGRSIKHRFGWKAHPGDRWILFFLYQRQSQVHCVIPIFWMLFEKAGRASPNRCHLARWYQVLPVIDGDFAGFHFYNQKLAAFDRDEIEFKGLASEILSDDLISTFGKPCSHQGFPAAAALISGQ